MDVMVPKKEAKIGLTNQWNASDNYHWEKVKTKNINPLELGIKLVKS